METFPPVNDELAEARRLAQATSPNGYHSIVRSFNDWFDQGRLPEIWVERGRFGMSVGSDMMAPDTWFWFNALPALAGLRLRKLPGFPLDSYCGLADESHDHNEASQVDAVRAINEQYFGPSS